MDSTFIERLTDPSLKHGKKRRFVAKEKKELYPDRPDLCEESSYQLKNGYWIGLNYSHKSIKQTIRLTVEVAGLRYGKDVVVNF
jgi:hypothetical protein